MDEDGALRRVLDPLAVPRRRLVLLDDVGLRRPAGASGSGSGAGSGGGASGSGAGAARAGAGAGAGAGAAGFGGADVWRSRPIFSASRMTVFAFACEGGATIGRPAKSTGVSFGRANVSYLTGPMFPSFSSAP